MIPQSTYQPLIAHALAGEDQESGIELLLAVGEQLVQAMPERCTDLAEGIQAACAHLIYHCQQLSPDQERHVKAFYGLQTPAWRAPRESLLDALHRLYKDPEGQ